MNSISEICIRLLSLVPLFTMVPIVIATADPGGMASSSPPLTMARFYVINNEGRSVPDEDTPTQKEQQNQQPLELPLKKSNGRQRGLARKGREHADNRLPVPDNIDISKAWQCEQHGFFFTTDGRCILPIIHVTKSPSGALSRRPFDAILLRNDCLWPIATVRSITDSVVRMAAPGNSGRSGT